MKDTDLDTSLIAAVARTHTDQQTFSGIEWAVKHKGDLVDEGRAGFADAHNQVEIPEQAIYRIYSMTKPIVSLAALMLVEQNKLRLYDPVAKYFPAFAKQEVLIEDGKKTPVTTVMNVEHLLTHQAGLSYDFLTDCPLAALYRQARLAEDSSRSLQELVETLGELPLAYQPGTAWKYSYATDVLAGIIEKVTGQSLADVLNNLLLKPLNMVDTAFGVAPQNSHRLMPMFGAQNIVDIMRPELPQTLTTTDVEMPHPSDPQQAIIRGGLGLFSTTSDYMQFAEFLRTGVTQNGQRLVSTPMFDMMWANRLPQQYFPLVIGLNPLHGYGWNLFGRVMLDIGQSVALTGDGEGGWAGAATTFFWVDRQRELSGVMMTQYLGSAIPLAAEMRGAAYADYDRYRGT